MRLVLLSIFIIPWLISCGTSVGDPMLQLGNRNWSGDYQMTEVQEDGALGSATCDPSTFSFDQGKETLTLKPYKLSCKIGEAPYGSESPGWELTIQASALFWQGIPVGTWGQNFIHLSVPFSTGGGQVGYVTINIDPDSSGSGFTYVEVIPGLSTTRAHLAR